MKPRFAILIAMVVVCGFFVWRRLTPHEGRQSPTSLQGEAEAPGEEEATTPQDLKLHSVGRNRSRAAPRSPAAGGLPTKTLLQRLLDQDEEVTHVPREQIEAFLALNKTNAQSLLAAWHAAGDREYLKQAAVLYPNDPAVQLNTITLDVFPGQQREWLDRFKQSAPENSLANYLSARDYFRDGKPELALKELAEAAGKRGFSDYTERTLQDMEEIYMQSGMTTAEAKAVAMAGTLLPHLKPLKELAQEMGGLQQRYLGAGDTASAEAVARLGWNVGQQLTVGEGSRYIINQTIGLTVEHELLTRLPPEQQPDFLPMSVKDQLAAIDGRKQVLSEMNPLFDQLLANANEAEIINFCDRMKLYGEYAALEWLQKKQGGR
ncbi:MAG: hypothetical protein EXS31_18185 [Pedosphaera sp.]|nr:hypothetical protein [Pedosphaera sp.]